MNKIKMRLDAALTALIDEYIEHNEPVSSRALNEKYLRDVSSATLRLDLMKLEKQDLIRQPHTSSGRVPTIQGFRSYLRLIEAELAKTRFENMGLLRDLLIRHYRDTPLALHYIMLMLAKETDQLSFVAEPEVSGGYLSKLEVFPIGSGKYIFVMSLDSGLDKTVVMKLEQSFTHAQLRSLVRYLNDELAGLRIYDIANRVLVDMREDMHRDNPMVSAFLREIHRAFVDLSGFYINYDGSINFLEQPEFDSKDNILSFMNMLQRQDIILNLMRTHGSGGGVKVLMGEDFNLPRWEQFCLIFSRYEVFGIPGFLGVAAPLRTNYRKLIPLIRDITNTITQTTQEGMMVPKRKDFQ